MSAADAHPWSNDDSLECVICPYCSTSEEAVILTIPVAADDKAERRAIYVQCESCRAQATLKISSDVGARKFDIEWMTRPVVPADTKLADVLNCARVRLDQPSDGPDATIALEPGTAAPAPIDAGTLANLEESLNSLQAAVGTLHTKLDEREEQAVEVAEKHLKTLSHVLAAADKQARNARKQLEKEQEKLGQAEKNLQNQRGGYEKVAEEMIRDARKKLHLLKNNQDETLKKLNTNFEQCSQNIAVLAQSIANQDLATKQAMNQTQAIAANTQTIIQRLVDLVSAPKGEAPVIVAPKELKGIVEEVVQSATDKALQQFDVEALVRTHQEQIRDRWKDHTALVAHLPRLFHSVEEALHSWKTAEGVDEAERAIVVRELQKVWEHMKDWQQDHGLERFPEAGMPLDKALHDVEGGGNYVDADQMPAGVVRAVIRSGYQLKTDNGEPQPLCNALVHADLKK